jgi:flagellar hook assembly protein FlgD
VPGDYYGAGHVTKHWYGANDEGEDVANGVYLCHIKVNDGSHTASEVIKIAVVRKD